MKTYKVELSVMETINGHPCYDSFSGIVEARSKNEAITKLKQAATNENKLLAIRNIQIIKKT